MRIIRKRLFVVLRDYYLYFVLCVVIICSSETHNIGGFVTVASAAEIYLQPSKSSNLSTTEKTQSSPRRNQIQEPTENDDVAVYRLSFSGNNSTLTTFTWQQSETAKQRKTSTNTNVKKKSTTALLGSGMKYEQSFSNKEPSPFMSDRDNRRLGRNQIGNGRTPTRNRRGNRMMMMMMNMMMMQAQNNIFRGDPRPRNQNSRSSSRFGNSRSSSSSSRSGSSIFNTDRKPPRGYILPTLSPMKPANPPTTNVPSTGPPSTLAPGSAGPAPSPSTPSPSPAGPAPGPAPAPAPTPAPGPAPGPSASVVTVTSLFAYQFTESDLGEVRAESLNREPTTDENNYVIAGTDSYFVQLLEQEYPNNTPITSSSVIISQTYDSVAVGTPLTYEWSTDFTFTGGIDSQSLGSVLERVNIDNGEDYLGNYVRVQGSNLQIPPDYWYWPIEFSLLVDTVVAA